MTIENIRKIVDLYCQQVRHPKLPSYQWGELYSLYPEENTYGWPQEWPNNKRSGVYFVFDVNRELLYVGKADVIGRRLSDYFKGRTICKVVHSGWLKQPHYILTIAMPADTWFEHLSLEAYLIQELRPINNIQGIRN